MLNRTFSCYLIGSESLLIQCAESLLQSGHDIRGILSNTPQICEWATGRSIPTIDPRNDYSALLQEERFDYLLSITNFSIIPKSVLSLPQHGTVNFHDGPLPDYAGLNVTTWAIAEGALNHAISWHLVDAGIDTGDILVEKSIALSSDETAFSLNTKCFEAAIETFPKLVEKLESRSFAGRKQSPDKGKYFGKFHRPAAAGLIDFRLDADEIVSFVRSLDFGTYNNTVSTPKILVGQRVVVVRTATVGDVSTMPAGTVVSRDERSVKIATATDNVILSGLLIESEHGAFVDADPQLLMFASDELGFVSGTTLQALEQADGRAARNDLRAIAVLSDPHLAIPLSGSPDEDIVGFETHALAPDLAPESDVGRPAAAATVVAFFAKICNQEHVDLRIFSDTPAPDPVFGSLYRDGAPCRFSFSKIDEPIGLAIQRIAQRLTSYECFSQTSADLGARYRKLPSPSSLDTVELHFAGSPNEPATSSSLAVTIDKTGTVWFVSRKSRMDVATSARLRKQFLHFSSYVAQHRSALFSEVGLLDSAEYHRIVNEWNQTTTVYDRATVQDLFARAVLANGDSTAIVTERERVSYAELDERSNRLATELIARGVNSGDRVGLCTDRSTNMMVGVIGILKAGAAYVPLDPDFPRARLQYIAADAQVADLVCLRKYAGLFSDSASKTLILDQMEWDDANPVAPSVSTSENDLAYVIHTSGSTGNPKGVMVRHRNVANFFVAMDEVLQPAGGTWLAVTSLSFDISVLELLWTLTRGYKVVLGSPVRPARETTLLENRGLPIEFSLFFFAASSAQVQGQRDQYRLLLESARFADEHGFVAIWSPERHFHSFGGLYPNPAITNAALATITQNVRLRAGSLVAPLHHPIRMAEEWAMVDNLSGGRVDAAFAAGWQPNDFVLQPQNFEQRKDIMFEQIETIQKLWAGEKIDFPRADGQMVSVSTLPRPVQKRFPVWITAAGNPETFKAAAEKGYNILTHLLGQTIEELSEKIRLYRETARQSGHTGGKITLMLHAFIGDSVDSVREIVREPMKAYLSTAMNLVKEAAWSFPTFKEMTMTEEGRFSMEHLSGDDQEAILNYAFDRYFEGGGLFGSVESCAPFVDRLKAVGVDEIGCLIDYGVDVDLALSSLPELARLLRESNSVSDVPGITATSGDGVSGTAAPFVAGRTDAEAAADISMYGLALREGVSHMQCTPSMARMLLADDEGKQVLGKLTHFLVGGEALDADLGRSILGQTNATLTNMYGPTETTVWSTSYEVLGTEETMPIGRPIGNNTVYVLGRDGVPVPTGSIGELYIGGDGVTAGYLNREDLTEDRFVDNPFSASAGEKMYRTGDLCRFRSDGMLEFLGRNDHQVKVRGYRIELDEIEKTLRATAPVSEVAVTVESRNGDTSIVAYVIEKSDGSFDANVVRSELESRLPPYMVPSQFNLLSIFPRTPNGKLDRQALPRQKTKSNSKRTKAESVAPDSDIEQAIADTWKEVLDVETIGVTDNFFDIGGHSLLAVQVNALLSKTLGESLSLIDLFRYPTVRSFAEHLKDRHSGGPSQAVTKGSSRADARRAAMNRKGR